MSTDLLFEQFATLATAPDGIARLRELMLQLAVQGKLGTQDAGDEPANILLERIRSRINFGGKKNRNQTDNLEKIPFQLPKSWVWTQIGNVALIKGGKRLPNGSSFSDIPTNHIYIRISNMKNGTIEDRELKYIEKSVFEQIKHYTIDKDDIYITIAGTIGDVGEVPDQFHGMSLTENAAKIIFKEVDKKYLILAIKSKTTQSQFLDKTNTQAQPKLALKRISETIIPLPPLIEQHRIVAKVDRLMALCNELEARQQQERSGCLRLGTASLAGLQNAESPEEFGRQWAQVCDAFDLIMDCPENVAVLRQTILQLAVQGRLSGDGDSAEWKKEQLENLVTKVTNGYVGPTRFIYVDSGIPYILSKHLKKHKIVFDDRTFISDEFNQKNRRSILQKGDVLLVQSGDIGNSAVVDDDHVGHNCHALIVMTPIKEKLNGHYLSIFFSSPEGRTKSTKIQTGMTLKHLNCRDVKRMIVPLPPLAEQHRIVAKVDALMALCDALEVRLKERATMQGRFTNSIVKVVGGENA